MNDFGFIDYQKPIVQKNDYRTSSYLGHLKLSDIHPSNKMRNIQSECGLYEEKRGYPDKYISEQKSYEWKPQNPNVIRNPEMHCGSTLYIKPYDECKLHIVPKENIKTKSVYQSDFDIKRKYNDNLIPTKFLPKAEKITKLYGDRTKPGFVKYLDPTATTNNLTFIKHPLNGIAAKDNITFWNWYKNTGGSIQDVWPRQEKPLCDKVSPASCQSRRYEYRNMVKPVPHTGMTTEFRDNFIPQTRDATNTVGLSQKRLVIYEEVPFPTNTESKIYGSGQKIQKYVKID